MKKKTINFITLIMLILLITISISSIAYAGSSSYTAENNTSAWSKYLRLENHSKSNKTVTVVMYSYARESNKKTLTWSNVSIPSGTYRVYMYSRYTGTGPVIQPIQCLSTFSSSNTTPQVIGVFGGRGSSQTQWANDRWQVTGYGNTTDAWTNSPNSSTQIKLITCAAAGGYLYGMGASSGYYKTSGGSLGNHSDTGYFGKIYASWTDTGHDAGTTVLRYDNPTATQHTPIYKCLYSGCNVEIAGTATDHTWGAWSNIGASGHQRSCTLCNYSVTEAHVDANSDGVCDNCTYTYARYTVAPSAFDNNYYHTVQNTTSSAMPVTFEVLGPNSSTTKSGRKLNFTVSVPANSTRTFLVTTRSISVGSIIEVGQWTGSGNATMLAMVMCQSTGSANTFVDFGANVTLNIRLPSTLTSSTAWNLAPTSGGQAVVWGRSPQTATLSLKPALNSSYYDYIYLGSRGGSASTVASSHNSAVSKGSVTISYSGTSASATNISTVTAQIDLNSQVYNGAEHTVPITLTNGANTLTAGIDYVVSYSNNINAGQATVTITGINNYTGTITRNFNITRYTPTISLGSDNAGYTGSPVSIKPARAEGVVGETIPDSAITYTYYLDSDLTTQTTAANSGATSTGGAPANRGSYFVVASMAATGNYAAATSNVARFRIEYDDLYYDDAIVDTLPPVISNITGSRDGNLISISARIEDPIGGDGGVGSGINTSSIGYMITNSTTKPSSDNANWQASNTVTTAFTGSLYAWVKASDNIGWTTIEGAYIGQLKSLTDSDITIEFDDGPYTYNGTYYTPTVVVKDNGTAIASENYSVTYSDNKNAGTATIVVTGHLGYIDSVTEHFTINPATITIVPDDVSKKYGEADPELTYDYECDVSGEYPEFSGDLQRAAGENVGTYLISNSSTSPVTLTGGYNVLTTNYTLSVATGHYLTITSRDDVEMLLDPTTFVYDGTAKQPTVTVQYLDGTVIPSGSYTVTYQNNTNVGEAIARVSGIPGVDGYLEENFYILPRTPVLTLTDKLGQTYNGSQITIGTATNTGISSTNKSNGAITYKYYTDENCSIEVPYSVSRTENDGEAPVDAGTYYVIATIAADGNYAEATSPAATLEILPKSVAVVWGETTLSYTGSAQAPSASASSGVTGETIELGVAGAQTAGGTGYIAVASIANVTKNDISLPTSNYTLTNDTTTFEIESPFEANYLNVNTNTEYETLAEALAAVASNQTIRVIGTDIEETTAATLASGKTGVKLDMNGKTITLNGVNITNNGGLDIYTSVNGAILQGTPSWTLIDNKGTLTINGTDSTKTIAINNTKAADCRVLSNASGKTVTLNANATIETTGSTSDTRYVVENSGTLNIAGATITSKANTTAKANRGIVNNNANARVVMTAGTIDTVGIGIYNSDGTGTGASSAVAISGTAEISTEKEEAIYTVAAGTISVSGGTISTTNSNAIGNDSTGLISVSGGQISSSRSAIVNYSTGTMTISGGTLQTNNSSVVSNSSTGTINITGGTLTGSSRVVDVGGGTANISGSTTQISGSQGVGVYGGELNISGGTINGSDAGIYSDDSSTVITITGGTITGQRGIHVGASTVNISGSSTTITGNTSGIQGCTGTVNISGGTISNTGSSTSNSAINTDNGTINITGGTISSQYGIAVNVPLNESYLGTINISGSTTSITGATGVKGNYGTVVITGGTITGTTGSGVEGGRGTGTVTIGSNDSTVSTTSPVINGTSSYGVLVNNDGTFNFYDGVITGATNKALNREPDNVPTGYVVVKTTSGSTQTATLAIANYTNTTTNKNYYRLSEAFAEVESNQTIKVLRSTMGYNINSQDVILAEGKTGVKLDLANTTTELPGTRIINNGELDIYSSNGNKGVLRSVDYDGYFIDNNGTLTVNATSATYRTAIRFYYNGNPTNTGGLIVNNVGKTVTLNENSIVEYYSCSSNNERYLIDNKGITNVNGALVDARGGSTDCGIKNSHASAQVNVTYGTIYGKIAINNTNGTGTGVNSAVNISQDSGKTTNIQGLISGANAGDPAVVNSASGTVNIFDGTVYGLSNTGTGVINVTGGTILNNYGNSTTSAVNLTNGTFNLGTNEATPNVMLTPTITSSSAMGVQVGDGVTFNFYDGTITAIPYKSIVGNVTSTPLGYGVKTVRSGSVETATLDYAYTVNYYNNNTLISGQSDSFVKGMGSTIKTASTLGIVAAGTTLAGWATSDGGSVVYGDGICLDTNVTSAGEVINLYAVFSTYNYLNVDTNTYYMTLNEAMTAVASNQTIRAITDNITETTAASLAYGKTGVKLDINGKTVTFDGTYIHNSATLDVYSSVAGGVLEGNGAFVIESQGNLSISDTSRANTLTIRATSSSKSGIHIMDGTLNVYDGTIIGDEYGIQGSTGSPNATSTGIINILGGTIESTSGSGIYSGRGMASLNISGNTTSITGSTYGVHLANGSVTVDGGTISGNQGIHCLNSSSTININGGTVTGSARGISCGANNLNITGGTISATESGSEVYGVWASAGVTVNFGTNENGTPIVQATPTIFVPGGIGIKVGTSNTTTTLNFYDGTITGKVNSAISRSGGSVINTPIGYGIKKVTSGSTQVATLDYAYTVNYYSNNTLISGQSDSFVKGMGSTIKTAATLGLSQAGFDFDGWATSNGGAKVYNDGVCLDSDVTTPGQVFNLYANWQANEITFNPVSFSIDYSETAGSSTIAAASGGSGTYTYAEVSEKVHGTSTTTSYFSMAGTSSRDITIAAGAPVGSYDYEIIATDTASGVTNTKTIVITINEVSMAGDVSATSYSGVYKKQNQTITVSAPAGATVTYSTDGTNYSSTNPPFINYTNGPQTVYYKVEKPGYTTVTGTATVTITQKELNVESLAVTGLSRAYDGTVNAKSSFGFTANTASGLITGDSATISFTSAVYNSPDVATASQITVSGMTVDNTNYYLSANSRIVPASISAKDLTIEAQNKSITFGDSVTLTYNATGLVGSETLPGELATTYTVGSPDGTYPITRGTLGLSDGTGTNKYKQSNYSVQFFGATITVAPDSNMPGVTATNYSGVYDGAGHSIEVTGPEGCTIEYKTTSGGTYGSDNPSYKNYTGGAQTVYYKVSKSGYTPKEGTATVNITKKDVTITWANTSFEYDGNSHAPTANNTTVSLAGGNETVSYTVTGAKTNVGSGYTATATINTVTGGNANNNTAEVNRSNYNITNATQTFAITTTPATNPTLGVTSAEYNGLSHSIIVSTVGSGGTTYYRSATSEAGLDSATWTTELPSLTNAGTLYVQAYVAGDSNHSNSSPSTPVTLTVTPKAVTITWSNTVFDYDETNHAPTAANTTVTLAGGNETVSFTVGGATSAVGTHTATATVNNATGGNANNNTAEQNRGNYTITNPTQSFTINTSNMTVTASNYTGVYDGQTHSITVNAPAGATIKYRTVTTDPYSTTQPLFKYKTEGPVTVYYEVTKTGYNTVTGSATVEITRRILDADSFNYSPLMKYYDGNRNAPEGFNVTINEE